MKKPDKQSFNEGFTLIEVIVATALLAVVCGGFLMMAAANASLLSKEYRLDRSNYELSARAAEGQGEAAGETLVVEFTLDGQDQGRYMEDSAKELFEKYEVSETWEDTGNHITFYRHK